ncbi:hypothetical protein M153_10325000864 [Pseudoloma neurophilia]|uniref:Uncharacterized protein n=1 Tax=Pseudoloma neurophilia TaxID=146866 RepID=A0A0R0LZN1_9MICR|nr:hypothetical protein M153_10325000864 [Pseudoloma neurophilia]
MFHLKLALNCFNLFNEMLICFSLANCLNLTKMKWLITHASDSNLYIGLDKNNDVGIIRGDYPENYDDPRIVKFTAVDPEYYDRKIKTQKEDQKLDDTFEIEIGGVKICGEREIVSCPGFNHDKKSWRIKSVDNGFRIYSFDKCITMTETSSIDNFKNTFDLQLLSCENTPKNIWKIDMMERNIFAPYDIEDKYLFPKTSHNSEIEVTTFEDFIE